MAHECKASTAHGICTAAEKERRSSVPKLCKPSGLLLKHDADSHMHVTATGTSGFGNSRVPAWHSADQQRDVGGYGLVISTLFVTLTLIHEVVATASTATQQPSPAGAMRISSDDRRLLKICHAASAVAAAALLLLLCSPYAAAQSSSVPATSASVQISPAIMLIGKFDWQIDAASPPNAPWSRCLDMVWRAASAGSDRLNFVPTHHWLPGAGGAAGNQISGFCYMHQNEGGSNTCTPFDDATINEFRNAMTVCFSEALRQGFTLYIRPHLDDGTASGAWRNGLLLQPTTKYNGYSYHDIMLAPLADALKAALAKTSAEGTLRAMPGRTKPVVYLGMQGEMSATVMRFASQWGKLVQGLKDGVGSEHADVKIGIGLNFNRLDDVTSVSKTYDSSRLSWLMWQLGAEPSGDAPPIDKDGLKDLLNSKLDFVGISAYAPFTGRGFDSAEFENSAFMFGDEMRNSYGIDIQSLINSGKLELQYSEFGLGGGANYAGNQPAQSPSEVALRPFFGIYGLYNSATDPWSMGDNRAYLREFYSKAILWLSRSDNKTYKLSSVFIWCMASWDILAIYPEDTTSSGSYKDPQVADAVANYNRAVVRAQGGAPLGGGPSGQQFTAAVGK